MNDPQLNKKYAKSLLAAALQAQAADGVSSALADFSSLLEREPELSTILSHPLTSRAVREKLLREIFQGKVQDIFLHFALLIYEKRPWLSFRELHKQYHALYLDSKGQAEARVSAALPLSTEDKERLKEIFKKITKKEILIQESLDQSLLGGLVVKVGDQVWDGSLRARLHGLKYELLRD